MPSDQPIQTICCCGSSSWSKIIGYLQIILRSIFAIVTTYTLLTFLKSGDEEQSGWRELIISVLSFSLFVDFVGIVFGIVLIVGTNQRRPSLLRAWIVFVSVIIVWSIIEAALSQEDILIRISKCLFVITLYGAGIWMVYTFKQEIDNDNLHAGQYPRRES